MGGAIDDIQSADYVQVVISKNGTTTATGTDIKAPNKDRGARFKQYYK